MAEVSPDEFAGWFDAHAGAMVLYARQWLDADAARDVVQDVFIRLASRRRPDNVRAWLFRSVRNAALNEIRSRRRRNDRQERVGQGKAAWFEPRPDEAMDAEAAQRALAELDQPLREVVLLRLWGGMTLMEIAQAVGAPVSTVHARYESALKLLRKRLDA